MAEQQVCNQTDPEMTIKKCEFKCCSEDKCNGATATPTSNGFSYAASFTATFMSVLVLSAKFFIH